MKLVFLSCVFIASFLIVSTNEVAAQKKQRIRFAKGASSASVKGVARGYDCIDYVVGARSGQELGVTLAAAKRAPFFTVFLPNGDNLEGAAERNDFNGALSASGDYTIRVCLTRADARRKNSAAAFTLDVSIR